MLDHWLKSRSALDKRALALGIALATLLWSCSGSESAANAEGTTSTLASTTSLSATTTTLSPEQAHIFEGEWLLTYTLEAVSGDFSVGLDPGDHDIRVFEVSPQCDVGPCDLAMNFRTPYLDGDPSPGVGEWTGSQYELVDQIPGLGKCTGSQGTVFEEGLDLTTAITLEASAFEISDRGWLVSELAGRRVLEWSPNEEAAAGGCSSFIEEYAVAGVPLDSRAFSLPASEPLPAGAIAYRTMTAELRGLVVDTRDGGRVQVPDIPIQYAISPDGRTIAYALTGSLWIVAADGSGAREILPEGRVAHFSELAWSEDGSRIAFVRNNLDAGADVWYVTVPYGVPQRVTEGGYALGGVAWGAEGESVIFDWGINEFEASTTPQRTSFASVIYQTDLETDATNELVSSGLRPSIGGSGSVLSYLRPDLDSLGRPFRWAIRTASADGTRSREVVTAELSGGCASLESGHASQIPCSARVSPDGSSLVFANGKGCEGSCTEFGFNTVGVWLWNLSTGAPTQIAESGLSPQWVPTAGG